MSTSNGPSQPNKPMVELITFDYEIETGSLKGPVGDHRHFIRKTETSQNIPPTGFT